jgi:CelD/BcsL family acetyltransferase involved in cellulose biosynthesis
MTDPQAAGEYARYWNVRPVWLRYTLGELKLFTARFEMAVLDVHFTELGKIGLIDWSGWSQLPASPDGVLIRSHPVSERLPRYTTFADALRYVPAQYERFYMDFQGTFDEYLAKFSSKVRANRKREIKKFAELSGGEIDWREYRKPEEVTEFLSLAKELSQKTFQSQLLDAGLPEDEQFQQSLVALAAGDKVRAYLLFLNGKPISFLLTEITGEGILTYRYLGYDPAFRAWSPGTVLHLKAFERLFAEGGLRMLDFTEGEGAHKKFFATASEQCADVYYFRRSLRNHALVRLHSLCAFVSRSAGTVLEQLGLKARVKRYMRQRPVRAQREMRVVRLQVANGASLTVAKSSTDGRFGQNAPEIPRQC